MSEAKRPSPLKRKYLVDSQFQAKFIFKAVIPLLLFVAILSGGFIYAINTISEKYRFSNTAELIQALSTSFGNDLSSNVIFNDVKSWGLVSLLLLAVILIITISILFVLFSNRIAGPILRIQRTFEDVLQGDLTQRIHLRENDELRETAEQINAMLDGLQARIRRIDQLGHYMHDQLAAMIQNSEGEKKAALEKIDDLARGVSDSIKEFKTES